MVVDTTYQDWRSIQTILRRVMFVLDTTVNGLVNEASHSGEILSLIQLLRIRKLIFRDSNMTIVFSEEPKFILFYFRCYISKKMLLLKC